MTAKAISSDGPHQGWRQSSTCRAVEETGEAAGQEYGLAEARSQTLARLLNRQAKQQFGGEDLAGRGTLDALAPAIRVTTRIEADMLAASWFVDGGRWYPLREAS